MHIFYSDLDNTLIYSYKHDIGPAKRCAEIYQGREISFMTEKTGRLLTQLKDLALIVPVTTRTIEQYVRIDMGIAELPYALTCNGGILLADGKQDASWFHESQKLVSPCKSQLAQGEILMLRDKNRCMEVRNIQGLFLFTKSENPLESVQYLKAALNPNLVNVFSNGIKIYIVPRPLNKGTAIQRFNKRFHPDYTIAAGDSEFDIPMLAAADLAFAPEQLKPRAGLQTDIRYISNSELFSDAMLLNVKSKLLAKHAAREQTKNTTETASFPD